MFFFQQGRTFYGHGATYIFISIFNLFLCESKLFEHVKCQGIILGRLDADAFHAILSKTPLIKHERNVESGCSSFIYACHIILREAFREKGFVVDIRSAAKSPGTGYIIRNLLDFMLMIAQCFQRQWNGLIDNLEISATR